MTGQKNREFIVEELSDLVNTGNELLDLLEKNNVADEHEYQKKRNMFISNYSKWYGRCLHFIRTVIPDKSVKFETLYHTNKRSAKNEYTYTVQDYIQGIYFKEKPKSYTDDIVAKKLKDQISILQNSTPRADDFSFEMEKFVKINPIHTKPSYSMSRQAKLIDINFSDEHYNIVKAELNSTFKHGFTMATFLLSRELIKNLLLDMIRIRYPPNSPANESLYYDLEYNSHRELRPLIGLIMEKKDDFNINPEALDYLFEMIDVLEPKAKPDSHSFINVPSKGDLEQYGIEEIAELILDIIDFIKE